MICGMTKERYVASQIIDDVECSIVEANPELKERQTKKKGCTFLHGECYYELEDLLTKRIEILVKERVKECVKERKGL